MEDVWGIGRQHAKRLNALNINTAYDFTFLSSEWVKKNMSVVGFRLQRDLQGIPTIELEDVQPKKNIATTQVPVNHLQVLLLIINGTLVTERQVRLRQQKIILTMLMECILLSKLLRFYR